MSSIALFLGAFLLLPILFDSFDSTSNDDPDPVDPDPEASGDHLDGTDEADSLTGSEGDDTIHGNGGDDFLVGDPAEPNVETGGGDDAIIGGSGDDQAYGGDGNDLIHGDEGGDVIRGSAGDDTAHGGAGNDQIQGVAGNDLIYGDAGNDEIGVNILSGDGNDTVYGGDGDDRIWYYDQTDEPAQTVIDGGEGADSLGFMGGSTISGGTGADSLSLFAALGDGKTTVIQDFDPAEDRLSVELTVKDGDGGDLTLVNWDDGLGADLYYGADLVAKIGGAQNLDPADINLTLRLDDTLQPAEIADGAASATISGGGFDDILSGGGGNDLIFEGGIVVIPDLLNWQGDADQLYGGEGNDTLVGSGGQIRHTGEHAAGGPQALQFLGRDTLDGGDGDDRLVATNGADLTGGAGADTFAIAHYDDAGFTFEPTLITDFDPAVDTIEIESFSLQPGGGAAPTVVVWADGTGCDILSGDLVLARVVGGQSLLPQDIRIVEMV